MSDKRQKTKSKRRKTKPKKPRLVGWTQFLLTTGAKGATYSFAVLCLGIGALFLLLALVAFATPWTGGGYNERPLQTLILSIVLGSVPAGIATVVIWYGDQLFRQAEKMKRVELITRHNTGRLPEVESLVRASDVPTSTQQAELLRASIQGQGMPPEQLLRATQESSPDV